MKRGELVRALSRVPAFPHADAALEQVVTPVEAACELLEAALARGDLSGRDIVDLGSGTGMLSIGAALLGAQKVTGVERDPAAVDAGRQTAADLGVEITWVVADVASWTGPADTVVMNPPFGAQRAHADRPFWEAAYATARRRVYAFAAAESRTFIERGAVARGAHIDETRTVDWPFPRTFPHHRKPRTELAVDLWVLAVAPPHERDGDASAGPSR